MRDTVLSSFFSADKVILPDIGHDVKGGMYT